MAGAMKQTIDVNELVALTEADYGFLKHCGEEARRWLAELRDPATLEVMNRTATALAALKRFEVRAGCELLAAVEGEIRERSGGFPSINHLLERYRVSARAYWHYLNGDLERAKADLQAAHDEVRTLIGLDGFLLPMAIQCADFVIQRARVARREKRWREAAQHIRTVHGIFSSRTPLCVLDSGREIRLSDLRDFFAALPLDEEEQARAHRFLGDHIPVDERVAFLEETIFTVPDLIIPYP